MSAKQWALHIFILLFVVVIDLMTKNLASQLISNSFFIGPIGLVLRHNSGTLMGVFSELPTHLRMVCLCTGGAFLFLIYLCLQFLLETVGARLRFGLTALMGGILANLIERLQGSWSVTDFLNVDFGSAFNVAFNFADIAVALGSALILTELWKGSSRESIRSLRRRLWVNPTFQIRYIAILTGAGSFVALVCLILFATYLRTTIDELVGTSGTVYKE